MLKQANYGRGFPAFRQGKLAEESLQLILVSCMVTWRAIMSNPAKNYDPSQRFKTSEHTIFEAFQTRPQTPLRPMHWDNLCRAIAKGCCLTLGSQRWTGS